MPAGSFTSAAAAARGCGQSRAIAAFSVLTAGWRGHTGSLKLVEMTGVGASEPFALATLCRSPDRDIRFPTTAGQTAL
jgi:hypothetical protein